MKISTKYMTINYTEKDREYMKYLLDYFFLFAYFFKLLLEATHAQARSI